MFGSERQGVPDRAERRFPCIIWAEALANEFAVYFRQIYGAGGRDAQKLGSQLF